MNILEFFPNLALVEFALGEDWVYYLVADVGTDLFYNSGKNQNLFSRGQDINHFSILSQIRLFFVVRIADDLLGFFTVYVIRFFNVNVIIETIYFFKVTFIDKQAIFFHWF